MLGIILLGAVGVSILAFIGVLASKVREVERGKMMADAQRQQMRYPKLEQFGEVEALTILPLIEAAADSDDLKTENGVAYLIQADGRRILFDVGVNIHREHPSPLLHNMAKLDVQPGDIDMIAFSHLHLDHVGGMAEQRQHLFSLSQGPVELKNIPVYAPGDVQPSPFHPQPSVQVIHAPAVLAPGIASIGVIPRFLFGMGYIAEQSLAIHVKGKGLALIIGCGHPTIQGILERVRMLFDLPIYAIIGGLHFPLLKSGDFTLPRLIQFTVASDAPPWRGVKEADVFQAIEAIKQAQPQIVSLSPHDSSAWSIQQFREAFGERYVELKVGKPIRL